ncbi:hypothetical protein [Sinomonas humi]|uniref:hypothetical protein n=1 Tax=Sinomonas humi TaxID=1338436 RepID=UPI0012E024D1|nr:hypothetical protein [Sinomonas humi]
MSAQQWNRQRVTGLRGRRDTRRFRSLFMCAWIALIALLPASGLVADTGVAQGRPNLLDLPRIPWEGGPGYWRNFPASAAAGWDDPSFFPIVAWYNGISSDSEAQYDKSLGINTYIGMDAATPYSLFSDNGMYWIGPPLNDSFTRASKNWVGEFLDDEVDGRYTPEQGRVHLQQLADQAKADGRFAYTNYTQSVLTNDMAASDANAYINDFTDVVSVDMYWYTVPFCSSVPYRENYLIPIPQSQCRTAASYGKTVRMLRQRDAIDGKLQPLWQFVENLNGGPGDQAFTANITPDQLEGAVMSSLINEARGVVYFNQSLSGPCQGGSIFRQSQVLPDFCADAQVAAVKKIDSLIKELAPVLNTQSYAYTFGSGLQTMLKTYNGSVYIFAMTDGAAPAGHRTFTLPSGVTGRSVQVIDEGRSIPVSSTGVFEDHFASESSFHVYRVDE